MKMSLEVLSELRATHSLVGHETPHAHIWKLSVCFTSPFPLKSDRLLDLVVLQKTLDSLLAPYQGVYLNDAMKMSPTSENIAGFLWKEIERVLPSAPLDFVRVSLASLDGEITGIATLSKNS